MDQRGDILSINLSLSILSHHLLRIKSSASHLLQHVPLTLILQLLLLPLRLNKLLYHAALPLQIMMTLRKHVQTSQILLDPSLVTPRQVAPLVHLGISDAGSLSLGLLHLAQSHECELGLRQWLLHLLV